MHLRLPAVLVALALSACTTVQPETQPVITPPEVTVLSDYPPVKAAVVPAIQALGYTIGQDSQYWTILTKPGDMSGTPPTRLTVTFASIRTHTRVISDIQYVRGSGEQARLEPAPTHPDRARIQAALETAKREVERQPASARRGAPPPSVAPPMPGAPRPAVAAPGQAVAIPAAAEAREPMRGTATPQAPGTSDVPRPGATRARVEGFRWPWQ